MSNSNSDTYSTILHALVTPLTRVVKSIPLWAQSETMPHDATKQDSLVSGTNIKTVNGQSILGSGNLPIAGTELDDTVTQTSSNGVKSSGIWAWVKDLFIEKPAQTVTTGYILKKTSDGTAWEAESTGVTDYNDLDNRPQIGGTTLSGNKTLADLGAQSALPTTGVASTTYAMNISGNAATATTASGVAAGSIATASIADGAVTAAKIATGVIPDVSDMETKTHAGETYIAKMGNGTITGSLSVTQDIQVHDMLVDKIALRNGDSGGPYLDIRDAAGGNYLWMNNRKIDILADQWYALTFPLASGTFALTNDIPSVVAPSTSSTDAGKAADAKATGDALAAKVSSFSAVGGQTPTVTNGVADLSLLFSSSNTSLTGVIQDKIDATVGSINTALDAINGEVA